MTLRNALRQTIGLIVVTLSIFLSRTLWVTIGGLYVATNHDVYKRVDRADLEFLGSAKGVATQEDEGRASGSRVDASGEGGNKFPKQKPNDL